MTARLRVEKFLNEPEWLLRRRAKAILYREDRPTSSHSVRISGVLDALDQHDLFLAVDFLELDLDNFVAAGLDHASDVARFDGKLAVSAVNQDKQLHAGGTAMIEQSIESRADGAPG